MIKHLVLTAILSLSSAVAFGHTRWMNPVPRDNGIAGNDGNKASPCGILAPKAATATNTYTPGQSVTLQFEETIDHPGRYFIQFSPANDLNFDQTRLIEVADVQGGTLPHLYTATVTVPTTLCENCTMQLIQSMEENPAAPSYYYSCFDMNIRSATGVVTPPGGVTTQSSTSPSTGFTGAQMGGCGSNAKAMLLPNQSPLEQRAGLASVLILLLPIATFLGLRRRKK